MAKTVFDKILDTTTGPKSYDWYKRKVNAMVTPGARGLINQGQDYTGGSYQSRVKTVEYVTISTTGNATDFGDCTDLRASCAGASNGMT